MVPAGSFVVRVAIQRVLEHQVVVEPWLQNLKLWECWIFRDGTDKRLDEGDEVFEFEPLCVLEEGRKTRAFAVDTPELLPKRVWSVEALHILVWCDCGWIFRFSGVGRGHFGTSGRT